MRTMASRTSGVLVLLELLQDRGHASGVELASELAVTGRTLRRYIAALRELDIPIEGQPGIGGGYRIRPGYRLPPLMFSEDEVVAVVVSLLEARASRVAVPADIVDAALAKVYRVLPAPLRQHVTALECAVLFAVAGEVETISGTIALQLADALRRGLRVRLRYTARNGRSSTRELSPYGLVVDEGFWYLVAFDHARDALRTFRVDRIQEVRVIDGVAAESAPFDFDPISYLRQAMRSLPGRHRVSVSIELPLETARERLPEWLGVLTADGRDTHLEAQVESLDWIARTLAGLGCRFTINAPQELKEKVADLGRTLQESAGVTAPPQDLVDIHP
jgi:predicted DNA-binding transcriptional regulator YafY